MIYLPFFILLKFIFYILILIKFLKNKSKIAYCEIKNNLGSSPREKGAWMLISHKGEIFGTIGGGQLEFNLINNVITQNWNNDFKFDIE